MKLASAIAAVSLALAGALVPAASASAAGSPPLSCAYEVTLDYAPYLSAITSDKHVIGSGKLKNCTGGLSATFRIVGDGPGSCFGQQFTLYQEIYWSNGEYSLIELSSAVVLGIGVFTGQVIDYAYTGAHVDVTSLAGLGFLLSCLAPGGVHQVKFTGTELFIG